MFGIPKEILEAADEEPVKGGIAGESSVGEKTDMAGETGQGAALETGAVKEETLLAGGEFLIGSPLAGTAILMGEVADATFASEVLGKGMAVVPEEGKVVATCEAEVTALFDTGHAIGLKTKGGVELLIHVGINTVELQGKYYETHVSQGDKVKPGQLLVTFDIEKIREAGYDVTTLVIVANTGEFKRVEGVKTGHVKVREPLIKVDGPIV
ncbi:MAG: PTS glucose transporter subunit IIA [Lachnospiraceae bacterium]|nr:PTS glucose transporter subunit IIA [Lachnospiraceae bacterium]